MQSVHKSSEEATGLRIFAGNLFILCTNLDYTLILEGNKLSLKFTCTFQTQQHNFSKIPFLPFKAAMSQAVNSFTQLASNTSSLRFTCTLPQNHSFSKISFSPSHAAVSQAVSPFLSLASNRTSLRFTCTSLPQNHSVLKSLCCLSLLLFPRQLNFSQF